MALIGRQGAYVLSIPNTGSFTGKTEFVPQRQLLSRMGTHTLGIPRVGSFAGKETAPEPEPVEGIPYVGFLADVGLLMKR